VDVVGRIAQIQIQSHDVVTLAMLEAKFESLADAKVGHVVKNMHIGSGLGEGFGQVTGFIGASVIDEYYFPAILILQ
jgi:hypothetical protein